MITAPTANHHPFGHCAKGASLAAGGTSVPPVASGVIASRVGRGAEVQGGVTKMETRVSCGVGVPAPPAANTPVAVWGEFMAVPEAAGSVVGVKKTRAGGSTLGDESPDAESAELVATACTPSWEGSEVTVGVKKIRAGVSTPGAGVSEGSSANSGSAENLFETTKQIAAARQS
jgi:hypothetical protein